MEQKVAPVQFKPVLADDNDGQQFFSVLPAVSQLVHSLCGEAQVPLEEIKLPSVKG